MWLETLDPILNADAVDERARDLRDANLNGLRAALVSFDPPAAPGQARIELHFFNERHVADILIEVAGPTAPEDIFVVSGGHRVRAGAGAGQVKCISAVAGAVPEAVVLVLEPIGDYSTYTLELVFDPARIDPFFAKLDFKFRPGCFTNDCAPDLGAGRVRPASPVIDYLAKDYDSFRHVLIASMMERVPGWQASSEADFDMVLIDLFAAAADELSDYQDRVMNEAYFATARGRISLARHARLMDYHIHQGQQSATWLQLDVAQGTAVFTLNEDLIAWTGGVDMQGDAVFFATRQADADPAERTEFAPEFNRFELHTWSGAEPALRAGATQADIVPAAAPGAPGGLMSAEQLADAVNDVRLTRLLITEDQNPRTGRVAGHDPSARQVLNLEANAMVIADPLVGRDVVRIHWRPEDALRRDYSFTTVCTDGPVDNISSFRGNLVKTHQGLPAVVHYYEPGTDLPVDGNAEMHLHYERQELYGEVRAVTCSVPPLLSPLAYLPFVSGGQVPPRSSLRITVDEIGGASDTWDEVISLVSSDDSAENGDHFMVETDERQESVIRFGNGINGRLLPAGAIVHAFYQVGGGKAGNVGADAIVGFSPLGGALAGAIDAVTNPFDVINGCGPEPAAEILRNAPEAYRAHQLRAVTLADYVARAQEVTGVQRAVASYAWTGSWRTVRLVIDPAGTTELSADLAALVGAHLESVRLIGEDIEVRPPRFVPLSIDVKLCIRPHAWPEDIRFELEQAFSDGWTADGTLGFFNPDSWVFGQSLHRSQIVGRLQEIAGVDHVVFVAMKRFGVPTPSDPRPEVLEMRFDEIALVHNDPDHMERGIISFDLRGGRQ